MAIKHFRGIRPDDLHGRMGLRNPERGLRTEMYFSTIPGEVAGMCSCHFKQLKLDGRSTKPIFQNIDIPGVPHLIRGNRLDGVEFAHAQWQDELDFLAYDGVTIMQSYCFLMKYDDGRDLPPEKLADIEQFFLKLRASGVKALLRFAYELSPTLSGPTAATVLKHLAELRPLLQQYSDVIYVLQCGFVGKFGEWHNSYHFLQKDLGFRRELLSSVLEILPPERKTMLRYPRLKTELYGSEPLNETTAFSPVPQARIGHFNDGFLAGEWHGGTFLNAEIREAEQQYLAQESRFVPMDGELFWRDLSGAALPAQAATLFRDWHYDTFGMVHGNQLFEGTENYSIDVWQKVPIDPMFILAHHLPMSDGYFTDAAGHHVWRSYYEYIRDHLGYRLELQTAELPETLGKNEPLTAKITLINRGFSAPVNPRPVELVLVSSHHEKFRLAFAADVRKWYGGTTQTLQLTAALPESLAPGRYQVGLALPDGSTALKDRDEYAIRCANDAVYRDGINYLDLVIEICD